MTEKSWPLLTSLMAFTMLLAATPATAQLPPEAQVDRLRLRAERQIGNEEYSSALSSLEEILNLQTQQDVMLPMSFWFSHAVASHEAGLHAQASASAVRYVELTGRDGEHYLVALELLDSAEAAAEREERQAEARRTLSQAAVDAQAESVGARKAEMAEVAAELAQFAPGMEMVVIPSGSFRMGCVSGLGCDGDEHPVRDVAIPRPFAVARHEVTFAQWDKCVSDGVCSHTPDDAGWGRGQRPAINVSWDDARMYLQWLSCKTGAEYRLLSESEWEYAARAGTLTAYSWGSEAGRARANCDRCGSRWDDERTAPVGSFSPNVWGLHDMHGNVYEWVQDCWNNSYNGAPPDGSARESGDCPGRAMRGGSWGGHPRHIRSAYRNWHRTGNRADHVGFRVARDLRP